MIKNNIEVDVKVKCIESGMTQAQLAEKIRICWQEGRFLLKRCLLI